MDDKTKIDFIHLLLSGKVRKRGETPEEQVVWIRQILDEDLDKELIDKLTQDYKKKFENISKMLNRNKDT